MYGMEKERGSRKEVASMRLLYLPRGTERLEKLGQLKKYPKGHIIIRPDEIPDCCYVVKSGRVLAFEYTPNGEERIYNFNEPGSVLLEANALMHCAAQVYFKTAVPTELICISSVTLQMAMQQNPELQTDVLQSVCTKFLSAMAQVRHENGHNVTWKICDLLLVFAERFGVPYDGKVLIKEKISQQLLSNMLGVNRITTVRAIGDLKNMNLIEQINGYYCIRDVDALRRHQEYLDANSADRK